MNNSFRSNRSSNGFTLIELLVVISIIAVLAGLAFPALQGALDTAKKAQASTMCNQLATAVTMYNTEYGVWPSKTSSSTDDSCKYADSDGDWTSLVKCLNGNNSVANPSSSPSNGTPSNSRFIQFMSFNKKDMKGYPASPTDVLYSPVTKAEDTAQKRYYTLICDGDYNGTISVPDLTSANNTQSGSTISQGVAVWANGDKTGANTKKVASYR